MRFEACKALGYKEVDCQKYGHKEHAEAMLLVEESGGKIISYTEAREHFIITDNVSFGMWDWDNLANNWNNEQLSDFGMDIWVNRAEADFQPDFTPEFFQSGVTKDDMEKAGANVGKDLKDGSEIKLHKCMCPDCGFEFNIEI